MKYQNIIFDFDGTLADSKNCSVVATRKAFEDLKLNIPSVEMIEHYMGIPIEISFKEMAERELDEDEFELLLQTFRKHYKESENTLLEVFPNIPKMLKELVEDKRLLFVVSSKKTDVLQRNLESLEILKFFRDVIGSDKVLHYKPHPDGLLKIIDLYQLKKSDTVMIGDAIFDLQMAKAAGIDSCGVTWGSHKRDKLSEESPTHLIDNVEQLILSKTVL